MNFPPILDIIDPEELKKLSVDPDLVGWTFTPPLTGPCSDDIADLTCLLSKGMMSFFVKRSNNRNIQRVLLKSDENSLFKKQEQYNYPISTLIGKKMRKKYGISKKIELVVVTYQLKKAKSNKIDSLEIQIGNKTYPLRSKNYPFIKQK